MINLRAQTTRQHKSAGMKKPRGSGASRDATSRSVVRGHIKARPRAATRWPRRPEAPLAPFHYPMPPVLPTEMIAHLGTADCCIHPPGRTEMIATSLPKIFSKEALKKRPPLPREQPPSHRK